MTVIEFNKGDAKCYGFDPDSITPEMMKNVVDYLHEAICESVWLEIVPEALKYCGARKLT